MNTIREATQDDLLDLVFLCKRFYKKAGYGVTGAFDTTKVVKVVSGIINDRHIYYTRVVERDGEIVGFVAYNIVENPFSNSLMGNEVFFWIEDVKGAGFTFLKLLKEYEEWCKARGACVVKFGAIPQINSGKIDTILAKKGFHKAEVAYVKGL